MEKFDLYRCETCGNIVEIIFAGNGELVCCEKPMKKLIPKTKEEAMMEKHVPIYEKISENCAEIRVGEILHPMLDEHYITFIQAISKDKSLSQLQFLYPHQEPKMKLALDFPYSFSREYCNLHGLWQSEE